jgi:hypothetical protein
MTKAVRLGPDPRRTVKLLITTMVFARSSRERRVGKVCRWRQSCEIIKGLEIFIYLFNIIYLTI